MTASEATPEQRSHRDVVSGYLAAAAMFAGIASLFWYPSRIGLAGIVVGLVAAGMASETKRFQGFALFVAGFGWLAGMVIAIMLDRPIF